MARRYRFLAFAPGVDWRDVNPALLAAVNRLGMKLGKTVTVTSGFRTFAQQQALYAAWRAGRGNIAARPGHSAHESGNAIDATIGGKAIASAVAARVLASVGLVAPVKGDPVHLQLAGSGAASPATSGGADSQGAAPQPADSTTALGSAAHPDLTIPSYLPASAPPQPADVSAQAAPPGTSGAGLSDGGFNPAQAWEQIAGQPMVSPESQAFAQRLAQAQGSG